MTKTDSAGEQIVITKFRSVKTAKVFSTIAIYAALLFWAVFVMMPFFWVISTSFKNPGNVFILPIQWLPNPFEFSSYVRVFTEFQFHRYIFNSAWLTTINIIGFVISCTLVAYAFATQNWKHKNKLFLLVLATMMLPREVIFYPRFILFVHLGWYGTMLPLWVPSLFGDAFLIFLLRQFFLSVPTALGESATIDGCGRFRVFWNIYLPLSKPALASAAIFVFMFHWNDFFAPLIFITQSRLRTAALALFYLRGSMGMGIHLPTQMAAALITSIPCILVFAFLQRYFIAGIVIKGVEK
jgi:ABC-type glycerol-3-phosphate transport system permease component